MPLNRKTFPDPVTVGTIRAKGHRLIMCCFGCGRDVVVDPDTKHPKTGDRLFQDHEAVPELHERHLLKCAKCGSRKVEMRPKYPPAHGTI